MPGTRLRGLGAAGNKYHTFAGRCLSQIGIQRRQGYSLTLRQFQIGGDLPKTMGELYVYNTYRSVN